MTFTTGVASGPDDFITQLCAFAVANAGFADQGTVTSSSGSGSRTVRRISKGGIWWSFARFTDSKGLAGWMGYSGIGAGDTLANPRSDDKQARPMYFGTWDFTGPYVGHYFFTEGTCVHAVVEIASGVYNHISFGSVTKFGTWSGGWAGGEYLTGGYYQVNKPSGVWDDAFSSYHPRPFNDGSHASISVAASAIRVANTPAGADFNRLDSVPSSSHGMFVGDTNPTHYGVCSLYARLLRDAPNETTNRTPIFPGLLRLRDSASGLYHLAGSIPNVGIMKFTPDMNPKDIVNTDWQVFPLTMRTGGNTTLASSSFEYALAYRRIP